MVKILLDDLIEEIKGELLSYEEISEEKVFEWEEKFLKKINDNNTLSNPKMEKSNSEIKFVFRDEINIFQLADSYWVAIENNEEDKYWDSIS